MYYSHGSNHSNGVLVLIREALQFDLKSVRKDSHGRFVIVEALVQDYPVLLINIYGPHKTYDRGTQRPICCKMYYYTPVNENKCY